MRHNLCMVRPHKQLHPYREPASLRAAATIVFMRDTASGFEVLMTQRSAKASFAPNAYVFPGGVVDAVDHTSHAQAALRPLQTHVTESIAALRESFEELGILLSATPLSAAQLAAFNREAALAPQLATSGVQLGVNEVYLFAHWVTDRDMPKRFDVPFFVARMPEGQVPVADEREQFRPVWVQPEQALAQHAATPDAFPMIFPTIRSLQRLAKFASADAVIAACSGAPLIVSCPRAGLLAGEVARYMEHESPFGELLLTCPDGQIVHTLDWQHLQPVPLLKNLQRLTAPNPSMMTGPGTNTYIVGERGAFAVIDPGADIPAHIERLAALVGSDLRHIICTHSHPDHSPGAARLSRLTGAPILGLPSATTAKPHSQFTPDRALAHGERLVVGDSTLRVLHTPGHAANHLCLVLEEDGLLFSGDHVLNGSTTVIDPPDGNLRAYLAALDLLLQQDVQFILPAHGYVLAPAHAEIRKLKAHRLARHAKVEAARAAHPHASADELLPIVYADVASALHPIALRSLLAHLGAMEESAAPLS
jgi:recombination protein RecT